MELTAQNVRCLLILHAAENKLFILALSKNTLH